ncbi:MAG: hypothetical protein ACRCXT_19305 [Paraclostridium sp.]
MRKSTNKVVTISTTIIIFISTIFSYNQFHTYKENVELYEKVKISLEEQIDTYLKSIFDENIDKAKLIISKYTDDIHNELIDTYNNDLDALEEDITNPIEDTKLVQIINDELDRVFINHNNNSNKPIVASLENIIWNKSLPYDYGNDNKSVISWNKFIDKHHNSNLSKTAVTAIKNMNRDRNNYIFWEVMDNPSVKNIPSIENMDIDEVLDVYKKYGIDAMKSYELLIPVYITNDGDIFGTTDANSLGHKLDNYKIIIIQRLNMYDIIQNNINNINNFNNEAEKILITCVNNINGSVFKMIQCVIFIFITLISSSYIQRKTKNTR